VNLDSNDLVMDVARVVPEDDDESGAGEGDEPVGVAPDVEDDES
jgi:hypothetical protein